nr:hypothetical protein [Vibrio owensii]
MDDQDKALDFYTNVLGFIKKPKYQSVNINGSPSSLRKSNRVWSYC